MRGLGIVRLQTSISFALRSYILRLRFSPRLFAEAAPEMFDWDEKTNALRLKDRHPPWIRDFGTAPKDDKTWLYCPALSVSIAGAIT